MFLRGCRFNALAENLGREESQADAAAEYVGAEPLRTPRALYSSASRAPASLQDRADRRAADHVEVVGKHAVVAPMPFAQHGLDLLEDPIDTMPRPASIERACVSAPGLKDGLQ